MLQYYGRKWRHFVKGYDIYASPVVLNYQGRSSYQTAIGGCAGLTVKATIAFVLISQIITIFTNPRVVVSYQDTYNDWTTVENYDVATDVFTPAV